MMQTCPKTLEMLEREGIDVRVEGTNATAEIYNEFGARGEPVGGLFYSTC